MYLMTSDTQFGMNDVSPPLYSHSYKSHPAQQKNM